MLGTTDFLFAVEKQAVVLDIGSCYTRIGFATEAYPRHTFMTDTTFRKSYPSNRNLCNSTPSVEEWKFVVEDFLKSVFFQYLQSNPKERKVVICEKLFSPRPFRQALAEVLFEKMKVPSILFIQDALLPLYLVGVSSGLIVDVGYEYTRIIPLFHGVPLYEAYVEAKVGGQNIDMRLHKILIEYAEKDDKSPELLHLIRNLNQKQLEDIKVLVCFVSCTVPFINYTPPAPVVSKLEQLQAEEARLDAEADSSGHEQVVDRQEKESSSDEHPTKALATTGSVCEGLSSKIEDKKDFEKPLSQEPVTLNCDTPIKYHVDATTTIEVPPSARWQPAEIFFDSESPADALVEEAFANTTKFMCLPPDSVIGGVMESLMKVKTDMRRTVCQNILLCGGSTSMRGFLARFALELRNTIKSSPLSHLEDWLGFAYPQFPRSDWVWMGGSVYGSMEGIAEYTKSQFENDEKLPDWLW
eukprot:Filipodium_phascolosomae@DN4677_c0_g1_i1.p1